MNYVRPLEKYKILIHPGSTDELFAFYYNWSMDDSITGGLRMTSTILKDIRWDVEQWERQVYGDTICQFVEFPRELTLVWHEAERATLFRLTWI